MRYPPFLLTRKTAIVITRTTQETTDDDGFYVAGTTSTTTIEANIQPTSKWNDMQALPQGERSRPALKGYTSCEVRMAKEGVNGWGADTFVWKDGETYEIRHVEPWQMGVLDHYKFLAVRKERT
jgi:hypothetical protein